MKKTYRLPNHETTTSVKKYTDTWRELGEIVGKAINMHPVTFDPGIGIGFEGGDRDAVRLDKETALQIKNLVLALRWFDNQHVIADEMPLEVEEVLDRIRECATTPEGSCKC